MESATLTASSRKPKARIRIVLDPSGNGNSITSKETDNQIVLHLKLASETKKRLLGAITKSTRTFHIKRIREKHLHVKSNAYGFNEHILKNRLRFETVCLTDNYSRYKIPAEYILKEGEHLFFKQQGFELQLFLSLDKLKQFEVPAIF